MLSLQAKRAAVFPGGWWEASCLPPAPEISLSVEAFGLGTSFSLASISPFMLGSPPPSLSCSV